MITYTRNEDGTYTKAGEFATVPAEVQIQIADGKPFAQKYTLAQAIALIEDAISKGQVVKDKYTILPIPEKIEKKARVPRELKAKTPKEPKGPRVVKYSKEDMLRVYAETKSLDEVVKQVGASRIWAQRVLIQAGVFVKPVRAVKAEVVLNEEETTRVNAIQTEQNVDRVAAIKVLRKEQRAANRPVKEPKGPRVLKYSKDIFVETYLKNHSLDEVCAATGASRVWAQRVLVQKGVWVKPVKVTVVVPEPMPAPPVELKAPKAKKEKPAA